MKPRGSVFVPRLAPLETDCLVRLLADASIRATDAVQQDTAVAVVVLPRRQPPRPLTPVLGPDGRHLPLLLVVHPVDLHALALGKAIGASSVLDLHGDPDSLLGTVRILVTGGRPLATTARTPSEGLSTLTARERDVMALVATGASEEEIGRRLGISPRTVHAHIEHVQTKLGVEHRTAATSLVQNSTGMRTRMWELTSLAEGALAGER